MSDFFDFGVNQGDSTLQKNREKFSVVASVPAGLPVADQTVTKLGVSTHLATDTTKQ